MPDINDTGFPQNRFYSSFFVIPLKLIDNTDEDISNLNVMSYDVIHSS